MKSVKLYYEDSFIKEFEAQVVECGSVTDEKEKYRVILDRTAFFPEEGGQECDTGVLVCDDITAHVTYVREDGDGVIIHITDKPLQVGAVVKGTILWEKRFSNMQHHTGEHIMSGLIKTLFDKDNVGFHLSGGNAVFDIAGTFTSEELSLLEEKANKAVTDDIEIVTSIVTKDDLQKIPCRSKFYESAEGESDSPGSCEKNNGLSLPGERTARNLILLPDEIRIVKIDGVDTCACCAPHVKRTGQIGIIKIMNTEHFRGGTRFTVVCGSSALKAMNKLRSDETQIMHLLSAKQGETPVKVRQLADSLSLAKQALYIKDEEIAKMLMQSALSTGSRVLFCPDIDQNTARKCVNELAGLNGSVSTTTNSSPVFFFIGNDETGYRFIIGSREDARETLGKLKNKIDIKGGGSAAMVNGTTGASREAIENAVKSAISKKDGPRMILASASPRRKEILSKLGIPFDVIVSGAEEESSTADPCELVKELALLKARDVFVKCPEGESVLVIGSDTVVDLDGKILGKPHNREAAERMLRGLSGKSHKVHTGLAVIVRDDNGKVTEYNESETSVVNVDRITPGEIDAYIKSGEPFDKAGSYAIQGLFAPYISSIEGDYYNIVGLPLQRLYKIIRKYYREDQKDLPFSRK